MAIESSALLVIQNVLFSALSREGSGISFVHGDAVELEFRQRGVRIEMGVELGGVITDVVDAFHQVGVGARVRSGQEMDYLLRELYERISRIRSMSVGRKIDRRHFDEIRYLLHKFMRETRDYRSGHAIRELLDRIEYLIRRV